MIRNILCLILLEMLCGCAVTSTGIFDDHVHYIAPPKDTEALKSRDDGYTHYKDFKYQLLQRNKKYVGNINRKAQIFKFNTGKSFFVAYELPESSAEYELELQAYTLEAVEFSPVALTLDKDFSERHFYSDKEFADRYIWGVPVRASRIFVNPEDRYLLVYTTEEILKRQESRSLDNSYMVATGQGAMMAGGGKQDYIYDYSPTGVVRITVH